MKELGEPKDEEGVECLMGKRDILLPNVQLVDVDTIIWHGLHEGEGGGSREEPQEDLLGGTGKERRRRKRRGGSEKETHLLGQTPFDATPPTVARNDKGLVCVRDVADGILVEVGGSGEESGVILGSDPNHHKEDLIPQEMLTNGPGQSSGLPYTDHLLAQISVVLPAMSSSQVSSVLSALEPNSAPQPTAQQKCRVEVSAEIIKKKRKPPFSPSKDRGPGEVLIKLESCTREENMDKCRYELCRAASYSWYRCRSCAFITTDRSLMEGHSAMEDHTRRPPPKLTCLACPNVFLSTASLKAHLTCDHQVLAADLHNILTTTIVVNRVWKNESKRKGKLNGLPQTEIASGCSTEAAEEERVAMEEGFEVGPSVLGLFESVEKYMEGDREGKEDAAGRERRKEVKKEREGGIKCDVDGCTLKFLYPTNLEYHKRCHSGSEWKCPHCETTSSSWSQLAVHLWKVHSVDLELYSCQECNYKTTSLSRLLNDHKRKHLDERPYLCDFCGKVFKSTRQLRNHKNTHKAKKATQRECELCGRRFSELRMLKQHTDIVHRKLRPYLCSICGYSSGSRGSFRMHAMTHTGEKPYRCPHCEYVTNDHNSLRRHKMQHTGAKHYSCPFCPYACIQSTTFKTHLRNKHPGMDVGLMFSCDYCKFKTLKKENFITHTSLHAAENARLQAVASDAPTDDLRPPNTSC